MVGKGESEKGKIGKKNEVDYCSSEGSDLIRPSLMPPIVFLNRSQWTTNQSNASVPASTRRREFHLIL